MQAWHTSHPGPIPAFHQEAGGCRPGSWELLQGHPNYILVCHCDLPLHHGVGGVVANIKTAELEKSYKATMKDTFYLANVALPLDFLGII